MSASLSKVLIHLTFSTKDRAPMLVPEVREELNAYLVGVFASAGCPSLRTNCVADHVHCLFGLGRTETLSGIVETAKGASSRWLKTRAAALTGFCWQAGYGAFSVGQSQVEAVRAYIADQEAHHRKQTFQDEFRALLDRYQVEYDERYLWS